MLFRSLLVLQDRFRKQSGFPLSVAFYSAQVVVSNCGQGSVRALMSSALFCCLLARLCLEALKLDLLVADRILFSACSRLARSGIMVVNFCLRALMASVSALTFFSCCWIMSWRRACSACSQIFRKSVLKFSSGLRCGLGRYWRPTGQELLLTCSFRTQSDFLALARLVSR